MRMYVDPSSLNTSQVQLVLEHNGQCIYWDVSSYDKRCFTGEYDVCEHINAFWAKLPAYRQEKIFTLYLQIRDTYEEIYEATGLITELMPLVKGLFEEHPLEELETWVNFHSNIIIPDKFDEEYVASDEKPGSREKTYLKQDYRRLVILAIALRIMIPVWGEFIYRTKRETGTHFKEYYAYQLLNHTHLMHSAALEKLSTYSFHLIQADRPVYNIVISGVGTEDFPAWLLAMVMVRRLCMGDVRGVNPQTHLVTYIFNYINQKITGSSGGGNFATMVKGKEFESAVSDEHNASRLEGYKIKLKASIGDIAIFEHYMDDPVRVAQRLKPTVDLALLTESLQTCRALQNEQILPQQVTLVQYVLKPAVSARGIMHLNKLQVLNGIAIAQTLLWEAGHTVLAALISAIATSSDTEMMISGLSSSARIPKELNEEIQTLFPYTKISAARKKTRNFNPVIHAIDELALLFGQRDWILTLAPDKIQQITGHEQVTRFGCPHDIKILLAKLIVELAKSR